MAWILFIILAVAAIYMWFATTKKKHINFSRKTLIPMVEWYSLAKHSNDKDHSDMCIHLMLESARMLDRMQFLDDESFAKIINVKGFNPRNFVNNVIGDSASVRVTPEYRNQLKDFTKPAREYFATAIIAIVDSSFEKEIGIERLHKLSLKSCSSTVPWK